MAPFFLFHPVVTQPLSEPQYTHYGEPAPRWPHLLTI